MPNSKQAWKRLRQAKKRNLHNRTVKSEIKTYTKKVLAAIEAQEVDKAEEFLRTTQAKLDKAVKRGILHRNTVNRRKSKLASKVTALKTATA